MQKIKEIRVRAIVLPVIGALGAIVAIVWPLEFKAFCTGLSGVVV